jgi:putative N6-adenine-specific DNA methylase
MPDASTPRRDRKPNHECLAVCTPGLENVVAAELHHLKIRPGRHIRGGVEFRATTRQLYLANLWLRTATRVLVRIASFPATSFRTLEERAADIEWSRWLADGARPEFRVSASKSKLYHTDAVAERLVRVATGGRTMSEADAEAGPDQRFVVRLDHDTVTVNVDASGQPLYQRGWRGAQAKAPLRETLAAAMLLAVGWDGSEPLLDPMCGSGTIVIEGAMIARRMAPGWQRPFGFGDWPTFEPGTWSSVAAEAAAGVRPAAEVTIVGADRDEGAVDAALDNAERAGVEADIDFERAAISDLEAPPGDAVAGWVVTNPPYGKRASAGADLRNLFARLGQVVSAQLPAWSVALLAHDPALVHHSGLPLRPRLTFTNGGLAVQLLVSEHPGERQKLR